MSEASVNKLSQDKEQYQDRVESESLSSMEDALAELGDIDATIDVQADEKANEDKFDTGSDDEDDDVTSDEGDLAGEETFLEMRALKIKQRFLKDGSPNFFEFSVFHPRTVADLDKPIKTENDFYLGAIKPFAPIGKSIKSLASRYEHYGLKSAYDTKSNEYTEFTHKFRPHHAHTEGGKGLTMYSRPVLYTKAGMCLPIENEGVNFVDSLELGRIPMAWVFRDNLVGTHLKHPDGNYYPILEVVENEPAIVYEYTLDDGRVIQCTPNHKFIAIVDGERVELSMQEIADNSYELAGLL